MSKLKSDTIKKIYKENFCCKEGHSVKWTGASLMTSHNLLCTKCGNSCSNIYPIRWECPSCNVYFCSRCFDLIIDKICPLNHRLKFYKQYNVEYFSNFTCDKCYEKFQTKDGVFFDKDCNLTFCANCYYDSCDIPEVIED